MRHLCRRECSGVACVAYKNTFFVFTRRHSPRRCVGRQTIRAIEDEAIPWLIGLTAGVVVGILAAVCAWSLAARSALKQYEQEKMVDEL